MTASDARFAKKAERMISSVARVFPALVGIWMTAEAPRSSPADAMRCCAGQSSIGKCDLASAGRHASGPRSDAVGSRVREALRSFRAQIAAFQAQERQLDSVRRSMKSGAELVDAALSAGFAD